MRRSPLLAVPLFAVACSGTPLPPSPAPAPNASVALAPKPAAKEAPPSKGTAAAAARYADKSLPAPVFTDPNREKKIAELVPKLEKKVDDFFAKEKPPSVAAAMVADGKIVLKRVLGARDRATNAPATAATLYRVGSISKTFAATLALSLRDEGALRLDEPAEAYLPELARAVYPFRDAPRITLRHLLTHTSGLPRNGDFDYTQPDADITEADMQRAIEGAKLEHAPGTAYVYSNFGMSLVGLIIGRRAPEKSLRAALAKRITEPLGMTRTTFDPASIPGAEAATGYAKKDDTTPAKSWRLGASEAAGGLWSSVEDMATWVAFQAQAWPPRDGADRGPVARASLREAHVPGFPLGLTARVEGEHLQANARAVGLAWHSRETCAYERIVEHTGAIDGFRAAIGFAPERGFGFVVLASSIDTQALRLLDELFDAAAAADLAPREDRAAPEVTELLEKYAASFQSCGDATYDALFTSSFRSAVPRATYKAICEAFAKRHGRCSVGETIELESPRAGEFALSCERGVIRMSARVSEEGGSARFGGLTVRSTGFAPAKDVLKAAGEVVSLQAKWSAARFKALFAKGDAPDPVRRDLEATRDKLGACRVAPGAAGGTGGDGERGATVPLTCEKGSATDLAIDLDDKGKVKSAYFRPREAKKAAGEERCVDPPKKK